MWSGLLMPKESHKLADVRTKILRGLLSVIAHLHSPLLPWPCTKKHKGYKLSHVTARLNIHAGMCCMPTVWGYNLWSVSSKDPLDAT